MPLPRRRAARRRRHREAVLGTAPAARTGPPEGARPLTAVTGTIVDASPHLLVLDTRRQAGTAQEGGREGGREGARGGAAGAETRVPMTATTAVWHGGRGGLAALRPGREVIVRPGDDGLGADRVWVDVGRVTGTILACGRDTVEVDMGPHRGRAHVTIPPQALERILVRHPRLEPGYLIDVICVRSPDGPRAVRPGTSQPGYRADDLASPAPGAPVPATVHGTVTWFGAIGGDAPSVLTGMGAAYPAVDPEGEGGGCADAPSGCVALPYLSLGSDITVHNECSGRAAAVPVVECGCVAARYCDRCVECGTSPRGRIAELTPAAFVGLGGDLDAGCFNAAVRPGAPVTYGEGRTGRW